MRAREQSTFYPCRNSGPGQSNMKDKATTWMNSSSSGNWSKSRMVVCFSRNSYSMLSWNTHLTCATYEKFEISSRAATMARAAQPQCPSKKLSCVRSTQSTTSNVTSNVMSAVKWISVVFCRAALQTKCSTWSETNMASMKRILTLTHQIKA